MAVLPVRRPFSNYVDQYVKSCKFIIRENGLLHYSFGLLSLTISEAQPKLLQWKLIVKMVDNCSIQGGCKQTNRFQGK